MGKRFPFRSTNNYTAFHAERRFSREREWKICSRSEKSERIASMRHVNILFVTLWLKIFCVRKRALGISVAWCGVKIQFPPTRFTPKWQIELRRFFLAAQLRHGNCWDAYRFLWCPSRLPSPLEIVEVAVATLQPSVVKQFLLFRRIIFF